MEVELEMVDSVCAVFKFLREFVAIAGVAGCAGGAETGSVGGQRGQGCGKVGGEGVKSGGEGKEEENGEEVVGGGRHGGVGGGCGGLVLQGGKWGGWSWEGSRDLLDTDILNQRADGRDVMVVGC